MSCQGCYKNGIDGFCIDCRKRLFDGKRVRPVLPFKAPAPENLAFFQKETKQLSISGMQLKYSLRQEGQDLVLTEKGGQYILKPVPPSTQLVDPGQAPENEHLTMQIAAQIFDIQTAANALIYFEDGIPAYLTKRFDINPAGGKYQQEDMAQLSGRTQATHGETFKYDGTYEEISHLIRKYVAAYLPALEEFFRVVVFNYLFSNGDAHLKNFSLIRSDMGAYTLSPAYDLMSTVLHTPLESDTALDLYTGVMDSSFYSTFGYYGQADFRMLADKMGIIPARRDRILTKLLSFKKPVISMIDQSNLNEHAKDAYKKNYQDKIIRMGMTRKMIEQKINPEMPGVYAPTERPLLLEFLDRRVLLGYFDRTDRSDELEKENRYTFIETKNAEKYHSTKDTNHITIVEGDLLTEIK